MEHGVTTQDNSATTSAIMALALVINSIDLVKDGNCDVWFCYPAHSHGVYKRN